MRNAALTIALLLCVATQSAFSDAPVAADVELVATPTLEDPAERMLETRLSNGLVVLTLEDHSTPVVSFQMWVKVGSRDESRYTGLAHLFEHMMFKGSKNIGPEEHAQLINARGGRINAFTSRDYTVYFADVTSETLPLVIELEAERIANLDISEKTLGSERDVVLEERRMRTEDRPNGRAMEALMAHTFMAHPYRWPVIGWRSDIEQATLEACREFFGAYYSPNNIVIAIAGDFDAGEAASIGLITKLLPDAEATLAAAMETAEAIAANSPLAVQGTKAVLRAGDGRTVDEALDYVALWNAAFLHSNDLGEAMAAYVERREPDYAGE